MLHLKRLGAGLLLITLLAIIVVILANFPILIFLAGVIPITYMFGTLIFPNKEEKIPPPPTDGP